MGQGETQEDLIHLNLEEVGIFVPFIKE